MIGAVRVVGIARSTPPTCAGAAGRRQRRRLLRRRRMSRCSTVLDHRSRAREARKASPAARPTRSHGLDLASYDHILVMTSGGKDSLGSLLWALDRGAPRERIELWHHEIDGREGSTLMDWPVTPAYCRALGRGLGLPVFHSWKRGGFEREMLREDAPTARMPSRRPTGRNERRGIGEAGDATPISPGQRGPLGALVLALLQDRRRAAAINNQDRFLGRRTLVITARGPRNRRPGPDIGCSSRTGATIARGAAGPSRRSRPADPRMGRGRGLGDHRPPPRRAASRLRRRVRTRLVHDLHLHVVRPGSNDPRSCPSASGGSPSTNGNSDAHPPDGGRARAGRAAERRTPPRRRRAWRAAWRPRSTSRCCCRRAMADPGRGIRGECRPL